MKTKPEIGTDMAAKKQRYFSSALIVRHLFVGTPGRAAERVLFAFDDHAIPWHFNTKLTLHSATKHAANPVLRKGPPGAPDHGHAILYGSVMHDGDKFRMWYLGMIESSIKEWAQSRWRPMCYAKSADGVTWTKPDLGLVEIAGSRHNNACLIEGEPHSLTKIDDFLCVLHEPDEPDVAKRYKAVFVAHVPFADIQGGRARIGPQAENWQSLITATSADGLRWKVVGDRPANAGGVRFEVSGLVKHDGFYYASGQLVSPWTWRRDGRPIQRVMMTYRSSDFVHWDQATALSFARAGQVITPGRRPADPHGRGPVESRQCARRPLRHVAGRPEERPEGRAPSTAARRPRSHRQQRRHPLPRADRRSSK